MTVSCEDLDAYLYEINRLHTTWCTAASQTAGDEWAGLIPQRHLLIYWKNICTTSYYYFSEIRFHLKNMAHEDEHTQHSTHTHSFTYWFTWLSHLTGLEDEFCWNSLLKTRNGISSASNWYRKQAPLLTLHLQVCPYRSVKRRAALDYFGYAHPDRYPCREG